MKLMIIESPGKIKTLRKIMSSIDPHEKWEIHASIGHVRDLPPTGQADDEITTGVKKDFRPVYQLTDRGSEVVSKLKRAAAQASRFTSPPTPTGRGSRSAGI